MFAGATSFNNGGNPNISGWTTTDLVNMGNIFAGASSFNQSLGGWIMTGVTSANGALSNTAVSKDNYDHTLIGWSSQTLKLNVTFIALGRTYSPSPCAGGIARQSIITNYNWSFVSDSAGSCP